MQLRLWLSFTKGAISYFSAQYMNETAYSSDERERFSGYGIVDSSLNPTDPLPPWLNQARWLRWYQRAAGGRMPSWTRRWTSMMETTHHSTRVIRCTMRTLFGSKTNTGTGGRYSPRWTVRYPPTSVIHDFRFKIQLIVHRFYYRLWKVVQTLSNLFP